MPADADVWFGPRWDDEEEEEGGAVGGDDKATGGASGDGIDVGDSSSNTCRRDVGLCMLGLRALRSTARISSDHACRSETFRFHVLPPE